MTRRRTSGQQRRFRRDLIKNASGAHPVEGVRAVIQPLQHDRRSSA